MPTKAGFSQGARGLGVLFFLASALPAQAQGPSPPAFIAHTIDGHLPAAPLQELDEDWSIHLGGKTARALSKSQWVSLRRPGAFLPPFPDRGTVLLTSGDRLLLEPAAPFRIEDDRLFLRPEKTAEISVPVAFLSFLCLRVPEGVEDPAMFLAGLSKSKRARDVIYLKNGDRIEGTLVVPARGPTYSMKVGERSIQTPLDQIAILALDTDLQAHPKTKKIFAHVVTTRGARLQFSSLRLDSQRNLLMGKTLFGANLEMPLEQVAALALRQGPAVYLSDLTPKNYEHTPFLGVRWPLVVDASLTGGQLALGDNYYDKGLGMHTQSQVTYSLNGDYRWFESLAGLEDRSGKPSQAKISVALDGKNVIFRRDLTGREPFVPVRVDVRKAPEMSLLVEFGDFGDVQGRVNWIDARLIRDVQ